MSGGVRIAPVRRSDGAALVAANRESQAHHAPWAEPFTDEEGFARWLAQLEGGANLGLVAREAASGDVVGVITLSQIVGGVFQSAYLGFYGHARWARRGLMTEAVRLAVRFAFDDLGLHRVEANIQPGNAASLALVRRLGFRQEGFSPAYLKIRGEWRDHERWAILVGELA